jgi:hypothetical protein
MRTQGLKLRTPPTHAHAHIPLHPPRAQGLDAQSALQLLLASRRALIRQRLAGLAEGASPQAVAQLLGATVNVVQSTVAQASPRLGLLQSRRLLMYFEPYKPVKEPW